MYSLKNNTVETVSQTEHQLIFQATLFLKDDLHFTSCNHILTKSPKTSFGLCPHWLLNTSVRFMQLARYVLSKSSIGRMVPCKGSMDLLHAAVYCCHCASIRIHIGKTITENYLQIEQNFLHFPAWFFYSRPEMFSKMQLFSVLFLVQITCQ